MEDATAPQTAGRILSRPDGSSIAYKALPGKGPGVVFIHGFMSDMEGSKALFVEDLCRSSGRAFVRFDQTGHGVSSGRFEDGTIGRWAEDTIAVLDHLTDGPQVVIGSSMGGWLMLLAALARPHKVAGLIGIAPAPDFTEDLTWQELSDDQRRLIDSTGRVEIPSDYSETPYTFTRALFDDGRRNMLLRDTIPFTGPVRILHGQQDTAVPWQRSLTLMERLASTDVETTFIKGGDHRLSEPADLERLATALAQVIARIDGTA